MLDIDLYDVGRRFLRQWRILAMITLTTTAASLAVAALMRPVYETSATIAVGYFREIHAMEIGSMKYLEPPEKIERRLTQGGSGAISAKARGEDGNVDITAHAETPELTEKRLQSILTQTIKEHQERFQQIEGVQSRIDEISLEEARGLRSTIAQIDANKPELALRGADADGAAQISALERSRLLERANIIETNVKMNRARRDARMTSIIRSATPPIKIRPLWSRYLMFGLFAGIVLGSFINLVSAFFGCLRQMRSA